MSIFMTKERAHMEGQIGENVDGLLKILSKLCYPKQLYRHNQHNLLWNGL
jgi:uncharacterized protein YdbL (DUF1318 family)